MKTKLANMFLDWFNNFLTIERFASYYEVDEEKARRIIEIGRRIHEKRVLKHCLTKGF